MVFGIDDALIAAAISAAGSVGGGFLAGKGGATNESKTQKTQRHLIDKLIASLEGNGPFSDLFNKDENAFQKSFVEPAQNLFRNQIAPQIQQQYIASGQQRGTGLDDQLLRAGVDLNSLLNQHMMEFQQGAQNRQQNVINSILGGGSGSPANASTGQNLMSSIGGFLSSNSFSDLTSGLFKNNQNNSTAPNQSSNSYQPRKGFEPEWRDWKVGDPRWGG